MSDGAPEGTPAEPQPEAEAKTFTQDQVNDLIAKEKGKFQSKYADYDDLRAAASELEKIKEANASELEIAQGKATKAEKERDEAKARLLRFEVAKEMEVPADAIDFLTGSTKEELEASATKLLELVKKPEPQPDFDGGVRETPAEPESPEEQHNRTLLAMLGIRPND